MWTKINRNGYGNAFNNIYIDYYNKYFKKECINDYGIFKINNEQDFYNFIKDNNINIPIPKVIDIFINKYIIIEYIENYNCIYKYYFKEDNFNKNNILNIIFDNLDILHNSKIKIIDKETYIEDINIETNDKIYDRIKDIEDIIKKYNYINKVNNIFIKTFDEIMNKIKQNIEEYIKLNNNFLYCPIHGDCQFSNILYNENLNDIIFIDPRGYFGKTKIYGLKEYDIAKVYFALSGYDLFDSQNIETIDLYDNNLNISFIQNFEFRKEHNNPLIKTLLVSIWLSNAHIFKDNHNKLILSHYTSLLFGTLLLFE